MYKNNQKKTEPAHSEAIEKDMYDVDIQACSATDCTGLIPSLPQSEAELEAYEEIYPYITQAKSDSGSGRD